MNKILALKNWQAFLLIYGLLIFFLILAFFLGLLPTIFGNKKDMMVPPIIIFLIPLPYVFAICMIIKQLWYWLVGKTLYGKTQQKNQTQFLLFKGSITLPVLLLMFQVGSLLSASFFGLSIGLPIILACYFYSIYFNAKTLKRIETEDESQPFHVEMFLFALLSIGIWKLQKRIQVAMEG